jgi:hypothetical protein
MARSKENEMSRVSNVLFKNKMDTERRRKSRLLCKLGLEVWKEEERQTNEQRGQEKDRN